MRLREWFGRGRRPKGGGVHHRRPLTVEQLKERCLLTSYSITDLGTLGGTLSYAYAINNHGQITGDAAYPCNCEFHPFLWSGGVLHDLDPTGQFGLTGYGFGINDLGQIVGESHGHPFVWAKGAGSTDLGFAGEAIGINNRAEVVGEISAPAHAFRWTDGHLLDLGTFDGNGGSDAVGINNRGEVVGQATGPNFLHAFAWTESGGMRDLGSLDGTPGSTSAADAINDQGQIVGNSYSQAFGTTHAVYFSRQGVIDLGTLGGESEAHAVNNLGQVVGSSASAAGNHAFLTDLQGGPMVDLNTLIPPDSGWDRLFTADGINDAGQVVGSGTLPGYDIIHAYLLTPDDPPAAALGTAASELGGARPLAPNTFWTADGPGDQRPLPPAPAPGGAAPPPSTAGSVARSLVRMPQAEPAASANGWPDPLRDALAR